MDKKEIIITALNDNKISTNDAIEILTDYMLFVNKYNDQIINLVLGTPMLLQQALPIALNGLLSKYDIYKLMDKDGNIIKYYY